MLFMSWKEFLFYDLMSYPVPKNKELFALFQDYSQIWVKTYTDKIDENYSYIEQSPLMAEYISFINRYWWLYRSLPFIKAIYICNSMSFNHINEQSDIDLFIIVQDWKLWTARFFSVVLMQLFWLRWYKKKRWKKFDVWFYITQKDLNLYPYTLKPYDLYFAYWVAHLVPLYCSKTWEENAIYESNKWINNLLPNHPLVPVINIWNKLFYGDSWFKRFMQKLFWKKLWKRFEKFIKYIWLPVVLVKKQKLWKSSTGTVITDDVLKFYWSIVRKTINLKFSMHMKKE